MRAIENIIQQIEGETRTGGNTKERVGAVLRLLKGKLEQFLTLFNGKLDKGNYEGTANDLANAIDRKVDKVSGKILSSNDFTNELRRKLEGLQQVDVSVLLPRGSFSGTAQDLKDLIDNLTRILQSPDTELDELREIVAYIKQNKHILSTLGIDNIAGLRDALNGKAPNDHHHDDRYSRLGHTHTEYALRTHTHSEYAPKNHRHNWNEIDGKPALATEEKIKEEIGKIQVGGRNYILKSKEERYKEYKGTVEEYIVYQIVDGTLEPNTTYTLTLEYKSQDIRNVDFFFVSNDYSQVHYKNVPNTNGEWRRETFTFTTNNKISNGYIRIDNNGSDTGNVTSKLWTRNVKLEKGNIATDWSPAPEDIRIATEIRGDRQVLPDDNIVYVTANTSNCDLQLIPSGYSVAFRKVFTGGQVTFTCQGKEIIYTGDTSFNGGDGSTAVVSIWNNKCYIDIRNI